MEENRRGRETLQPLNPPRKTSHVLLGLMGFCVQELESKEESPQQKWRLMLEAAQGCPRKSGILGRSGKDENLEDLGLEGNLIPHTWAPQGVRVRAPA